MSSDDVASLQARIAFLESQLDQRRARPQDQSDRVEQPTRDIDDVHPQNGAQRREEGGLSEQLSLMRADMAKLSDEVKALRLELELQRNPDGVKPPSAPSALQPPSVTITPVVDGAPAVEQASQQVGIPLVPRKRGRPRKIRVEIPPEVAPDGPVVPRKRGRPRKIRDEIVTDVPTVPRKRGRPRKIRDENPVEVPNPPKKRGRPSDAKDIIDEATAEPHHTRATRGRPSRTSWPPKPPTEDPPNALVAQGGSGSINAGHTRSPEMTRLADVMSNPGPSKNAPGEEEDLGGEGDTEVLSNASEDVVMVELTYP